jgi:hypothetical protein
MDSLFCETAGRDRTFRAIGHNLVSFQRLEKILKWLAESGSITCALPDLEKQLKRRREIVERSTLGTVIALWVEAAHGRQPGDVTPKTGREVFISFWHQLNIPEHVLDQHAKELHQHLTERNWLVHEGLAEVDFDCDVACESLLARLDDQRKRIIKQIDFLRPIVNRLREASEILASDDLQEWIWKEMLRAEPE